MDRTEIKKVLEILRVAYPRHYQNMTNSQLQAQINLYEMFFKNEKLEIMITALKEYIACNEFPPTVAGLNKALDTLKQVVSTDSVEFYVNESWKAICGILNFDDLSEVSQTYWGNPEAIRNLGYDERTSYSIVAGQMQRRIPEIIKRIETQKKIPPKVKELLRNQIEKGVKNIEG